MYKTVLFLILLTVLVSCTERERNNIFDPNSGIGTIDVGLRATALETSIQLSWYSAGDIDYNGVKIYRRQPFEDRFEHLITLPRNRYSYTDTIALTDETYTYYMTLIGSDFESPPSRQVQAIAGPGDIWILDRWDFEALNLSYDLRVIKKRRYGVWIPENMAIAKQENLAMITYPLYGYFEIFDINRSYERLYGWSDLERPFDCIFETASRSFWVTDSSSGLYKVSPRSGIIITISTDLVRPTLLGNYDNQTIYLIDKGTHSLNRFGINGENLGKLNKIGDFTLQSPKLFEIDNRNNVIYIVDKTEDGNFLYAYQPASGDARILYTGDNIDVVAPNEAQQTVWIVTRIDFNPKIMQLSRDGTRLTELEGYEYPIDIGVNPYNNNLIIVDAGTATVRHLRSDISEIGSYGGSAQPYKVLIE